MAGVICSSGWAQDPTPVYLLNFEGADAVDDFGGTQHGSGALIQSSDSRFGKYYQNWPDASSPASATVNYLEVVPTTNPWESLRTSGTGAFTISFWCNASVAKDNNIDSYWGSLFTGYKDTGTSETRTWFYQVGPDLRFAGQYHHNNGGYSDDNADDYRDGIIPWREDKAWHHFAWVFSNVGNAASFNLSLYLDGTKKYEKAMTVNGDGAKAVNMLVDLDRFVIGGASPIFSGDPDNAFAYDDIAFYTSALSQDQIQKIITEKLSDHIVIGATKWGTYVSEFPLDFTGITTIEAYKVTGATGSAITKEQLTGIVPAGTPMLLNAPGGANTYPVPVATTAGSPVGDNCLKAGTGEEVSKDGTDTYDRYVLVANGETAKFKIIGANSPTVARNRAYLQLPYAASSSRDILSIDGGDATAIKTMKVGTEDNIYYNLQGQRVLYPTKGLYIVNGKKVIIK